jgi:hypothetical protein
VSPSLFRKDGMIEEMDTIVCLHSVRVNFSPLGKTQ